MGAGGELGGAAGLDALRRAVTLATLAPFGDALGAAAGAVAGRTFCAAAARALAQLARLGASSFGAAVSDFVTEAVEAVEGAEAVEPVEAVEAVEAGLAGTGLAVLSPRAAVFAVVAGASALRVEAVFAPELAVPLAAASLVAAAVSDAVFAIGTRAAARAAAASAADSAFGAAAAAADGAGAAAGAAGGGGGALSMASTTGSSSVSSSGASGAFVLCSLALTTGTAVEACPGARNISGSTKFSPVCSGSLGFAGSAGAAAAASGVAAASRAAAAGSLRAFPDSNGSSIGKSGSASSGGRDAASIGRHI